MRYTKKYVYNTLKCIEHTRLLLLAMGPATRLGIHVTERINDKRYDKFFINEPNTLYLSWPLFYAIDMLFSLS